jgi:hypothetical protein
MWNLAQMLATLDESLTLVVDRCAAPYMALRGGGGGFWHAAAGELVQVNATRAPKFKLWR